MPARGRHALKCIAQDVAPTEFLQLVALSGVQHVAPQFHDVARTGARAQTPATPRQTPTPSRVPRLREKRLTAIFWSSPPKTGAFDPLALLALGVLAAIGRRRKAA